MNRTFIARALVAALISLFAVPAAASAAPFTVNSAGDSGDASPGNGSCATSAGKCTLRAALEETNAGNSAREIRFALGSGVHHIQPATGLPAITERVTIDGFSQAGSKPATSKAPADVRISLEGPLVWQTDGVLARYPGLVLEPGAKGSIVRGLAINGFMNGAVILSGSDKNRILGNHIGTGTDGVSFGSNPGNAILIDNADGNRIGGKSSAERNVIGGHSGTAVLARGGSANRVTGNYIGLDARGEKPANGTTLHGIRLLDSRDALIEDNHIAAIRSTGLALVDGGRSRVRGNVLGTDVSGREVVRNLINIEVFDSPGNTIGGAGSARNVIAGSETWGITVSGSGGTGNRILGNYIGTDRTGLKKEDAGGTFYGNWFGGVSVGSPKTVVGAPGAGNLIAMNGEALWGDGFGIVVNSGGSDAVIQSNILGLDATGGKAKPDGSYTHMGNGGGQVLISGAARVTVGGTSPKQRNVLADAGYGFLSHHQTALAPAMWIKGASSTKVQGNYFGLDSTGRQLRDNGSSPVLVTDSRDTLIGGEQPGARNVMAARRSPDLFSDRLIEVDPHSPGTRVIGNYIGTDVTGTKAFGANSCNVIISTTDIEIDRNLIVGSRVSGIQIGDRELQSTGGRITRNWIGVDSSGRRQLGNGDGINVLGGSGLLIEDNVVSGSDVLGIQLHPTVSGTQLRGNLIGTDATGSAAIPNGSHGLELWARDAVVGGTRAGDGNTISGNGKLGVMVVGTQDVALYGNNIGTDRSGTRPLGNAQSGFEIQASRGVVVGGLSSRARNTIAHNRFDGIIVAPTSTENAIRGNAIHSNGARSVELLAAGPIFGPDPIDALDSDNGANGLQNFPEVEVTRSPGRTAVRATLRSTPDSSFELDFYASPSGASYLATKKVRTNSSGVASVSFVLNRDVAGRIEATATDAAGNTSEYASGGSAAPRRVARAFRPLSMPPRPKVAPVAGDAGSAVARVGADGTIQRSAR